MESREKYQCFCLVEENSIVEIKKEEVPSFLSQGKFVWVDIFNADRTDTSWLSETFGFHSLALEDVLNNSVRPKQEIFDDVLFTVFGAINLNPGEEALNTINLNIFLTKNCIVTTHQQPLKTIRRAIERIRKKTSGLKKGVDYFYYTLLDGVVDRYFDVLDELEEELQVIEDRVFGNSLTNVQEEIFKVKKKIAYAKRSIHPQRDALRALVLNDYPQLTPNTQTHLRDVLDHILRIADTLESQKELVSGLMDSYMTQISNKMNEVMKLMSIIATVVLPLSFLTGLFGMNFENMPGLGLGESGFWALIALMIIMAIGILGAFKKYKIL